MTTQIKDDLNNVDINLNNVTKVIEEKTTAYADFTTFIVIYFVGGESISLKGWTLERWRNFQKDLIRERS